MAGGVHAAVVPCMKCYEAADRIAEGTENDDYRCRSCAAEFSVDWSFDGPPTEPCWPPQFQWWLLRNSLPDRLWARQTIYCDQAARVFSADGEIHFFHTVEKSTQWLEKQDYAILSKLIESGEVPADVTPPTGRNDAELLPKMIEKL